MYQATALAIFSRVENTNTPVCWISKRMLMELGRHDIEKWTDHDQINDQVDYGPYGSYETCLYRVWTYHEQIYINI